MNPKIEQLRTDALAEALKSVLLSTEDGPGRVERVRAAQEQIIARRGRDGRDLRWIAIPVELLSQIIARLDGPTSAGRHLGISAWTIQRWRSKGRIPSWALDRCRELIASGAPSRKRPNRARDRHYLPRPSDVEG